MENSSSAFAAVASTSKRRRCRSSMLLLFTLAMSPGSSSAKRVSRESPFRRDGRSLNVYEYRLPGMVNTPPTMLDKPGVVFYEEENVDELGGTLTRTRQQGDPDLEYRSWQWRHRTSGYTSDDDCTSKATKASKSSKSTKGSSAPSSSQHPTGMPSLSSEPSLSNSPSTQPSERTNSPSTQPSGSQSPSLSFYPTGSKSAKSSKTAKSSKSSRCESPTVSEAPSTSNEPTITPMPSLSDSPSDRPSTSSMPSESNAPSTFMAPSVSRLPSQSPSTSSAPSTSNAPTVKQSKSSKSWSSKTASEEDDCQDIIDMDFDGTGESFFDENGDARSASGSRVNAADAAFDVSFHATYDAAALTPEGVAALLDTYLSVIIALWVAGCNQAAVDIATDLGWVDERRRRLEGRIEYCEMRDYDPSDACPDADSGNQRCIFSSVLVCTTKGGDVSEADLQTLIREAYIKFGSLFENQPGVIEFNPDDDLTIDSATDDWDAIIENENPVPDETIAAGTIIGIVAAGLAFILLLVLLIRRRQEGDEPSHYKLDDDENEATFIREFQTDPSSDGSPYRNRNVHVVGEGDSIISGWTGFTKQGHAIEVDDDANNPGKLGHAHGDVHLCSSATCEVCELKRRNGVQFQPTGTPPPQTSTHLPSDASREYISEDTVEL